MQVWTQFKEYYSNFTWLNNTAYSYIMSVLLLVGLIIAAKIIHAFFMKVSKKIAEKTKNQLDNIIIGTLNKPLLWGLYFTAIYFSINILTFSNKHQEYMNKIWVAVITIIVGSFVYSLWNQIAKYYLFPMAERSKNTIDDHIIPIIYKTVKVVIIILIVMTALSNLGYDIFSLIAGLGIGGFAIALAAQDTIGNLFSGLAIFLDKPFTLRDVITVESETGTVEEIGLRTTRIRTFDDELVVLPNSKITNNKIKNVSQRRRRKVVFNLGLVYDTTTEKLRKAKNIVTQIINDHKNVDEKDVLVYFTDFGDFALIIQVIYWTKSLDYLNLLKTKEEINFEIKDKFEQENIGFAFPTYTIENKIIKDDTI